MAGKTLGRTRIPSTMSALLPPTLVPAPVQPPPPPPYVARPTAPKPRERLPASSLPLDSITEDVLLTILSHATSVAALRKYKHVSKLWRSSARETLCDTSWLARNVTLHQLLKAGNPSPKLVMTSCLSNPFHLSERDEEGLLPLQYAAAYRMESSVVDALRSATAKSVPGGIPHMLWAKAVLQSKQLRPVRTRLTRAPIAD